MRAFLLIAFLHAVQLSAASLSFSGTVTDPAGAAIPGATVKVLAPGKGVISQSDTNARGEFRTVPIAEGLYELIVAHGGFEAQHLSLRLYSQLLPLHIKLPLARQQYSMTVTDNATPKIPFWLMVFKNIRVFFLGSDDFTTKAKVAATRDLNAALEAG